MAELLIKPVAWAGEIVLKYRASVVFEDNSIMSGDPEPTKEDAVRSLAEECKAWSERVKVAKAIVKKELKLTSLR